MEVFNILSQKLKSSSSNKVIFYCIIYLIALQFIINAFVPSKVVYNHRLDYDLVKDRPTNIEAVLKEIKTTIANEELDDYVVILGDSVSYSSPGPSNTSIGYYLNQIAQDKGKKFRIFNLAMPSMQAGDIYTLLLKMDQYGISRDNVIINVLYAGFVEKLDTPPVFWLDKQLKHMDPITYKEINTLGAKEEKKQSQIVALTQNIKDKLYENIPLFQYKDYLQVYIKEQLGKLRGHVVYASEPVQPWYEKPFLKDLLGEYEYQVGFNSTPFIMDNTNTQIHLLDKIINLQEGKNTLIYLAPINEELVGEYLDKENYFKNVKMIDEYFEEKPVKYINYYGKISFDFFSDQVHYTSDGYKYLADLLWDQITVWNLK